MGQAGKRLQTSLRGIANKAREDRRHRFGNLYGLLDEEALLDSWRLLNKSAAGGVDGVTAAIYAENLHENIHGLVERLKRKHYRAKLVRRRHIPKDETSTRPLGLPALEDKLLQLAVSRILEAIFEPSFRTCSYAYRKGRGAHQAVRDLTQELQFGCYGYVVDVDIKGFFDNIDHDKLLEIMAMRIDDRPFLRLIKKWLKAGVLEEDGSVIHPGTGCPQGGTISPILANLYLHVVLDHWFEVTMRPHFRYRSHVCRYADDVVFAFQRRTEAEHFYKALRCRLGRYGLELSEKKSRIVRFSRFQLGRQSDSFEFLGFEFRWMKDRNGVPRVKRRTSRKRFRKTLAALKEWCRSGRSTSFRALLASFDRRLVGHYNYYGVMGNSHSLWSLYLEARRLLYKWLNRRSQKRSYSWRKFTALLRRYRVTQPRIMECRRRQLVLSFAG